MQAIATGTVQGVRDELLAGTEAVRRDFLAAIDHRAEPATRVEAAVLQEFMAIYGANVGTIERAAAWPRWNDTIDGSSYSSMLSGIRQQFGNLHSVQSDLRFMSAMVAAYPWLDPPCQAPDWEELVRRTQAKLDRGLEAWRNSPYEGDKHNIWGHLLQYWHLPRFEVAREHGWWISLMGIESSSEVTISYFENRTTTEVFPTVEEAAYLLAQRRHEGRTFHGESYWRETINYLDDPLWQTYVDWATEPSIGAYAFMVVLEGPWTVRTLDCPAEAALG
jgi:hypothetical protein